MENSDTESMDQNVISFNLSETVENIESETHPLSSQSKTNEPKYSYNQGQYQKGELIQSIPPMNIQASDHRSIQQLGMDQEFLLNDIFFDEDFSRTQAQNGTKSSLKTVNRFKRKIDELEGQLYHQNHHQSTYTNQNILSTLKKQGVKVNEQKSVNQINPLESYFSTYQRIQKIKESQNIKNNNAKITKNIKMKSNFSNKFNQGQKLSPIQFGKDNCHSKTLKRISKQKQSFLKLGENIRNLYLKTHDRRNQEEQINIWEIIYMVKLHSLQKQESKLLAKVDQMNQLISQFASQKKIYQEEIKKMDEINREMLCKLKKIQQLLLQIDGSPSISCQLSFFKDQTGNEHQININRFNDHRSLSLTNVFINSIQELQIKQLQEEERLGLTDLERKLIQILDIYGKKAEGQLIQVNEDLISKLTTKKEGGLYKSLKKIDNYLNLHLNYENILPDRKTIHQTLVNQRLAQFLNIVQDKQQQFISKINYSSDKDAEFSCFEFSCWITMIGLVVSTYSENICQKNQFPSKIKSSRREEIEMNLGIMKKIINIIAMKTGVNVRQNFDTDTDSNECVGYSQFIQEIIKILHSLIDILV